MAGVAAMRAGNHVDDIGAAIEDVAVEAGYGIVRGYTGHGIGTSMHDDPSVFNFRTGRPGAKLEVGMCLAIEPMFMIGEEDTEVLRDGWTVVTADRSLAAHFEHTVAVTAQGPEILTRA